MKKPPFIFSFILLLLLISVNCHAVNKLDKQSQSNDVGKSVTGKPCKGFDPKTDEVIEVDAQGNCVYYETGDKSSGVTYIYNANGEFWSRSYYDE